MMYYCDGASFSGYRKDPVPVRCSPGHNCTWPSEDPDMNVSALPKLYFRGIRNFDATIDALFDKHGFGQAKEVVLSGGSAGGLSTFLHLDRLAARIPEANVASKPGTVTVPFLLLFFVLEPLYIGATIFENAHSSCMCDDVCV